MDNLTATGMSFHDFLRALLHYWYVWVLTALIVTTGAFFWGQKTTVPTYQASSTVMIYHPNNDPNQRQADIMAMASYRKLMTSPKILAPVQKQLTKLPKYQGNQETLAAGITTHVPANTLTLKIKAQGRTPHLATQTVNLLAKSVQQHLPKLAPNSGEVHIVAWANQQQASLINGQRVPKITIGGLLFGLYLGLLAVFVLAAWRR